MNKFSLAELKALKQTYVISPSYKMLHGYYGLYNNIQGQYSVVVIFNQDSCDYFNGEFLICIPDRDASIELHPLAYQNNSLASQMQNVRIDRDIDTFINHARSFVDDDDFDSTVYESGSKILKSIPPNAIAIHTKNPVVAACLALELDRKLCRNVILEEFAKRLFVQYKDVYDCTPIANYLEVRLSRWSVACHFLPTFGDIDRTVVPESLIEQGKCALSTINSVKTDISKDFAMRLLKLRNICINPKQYNTENENIPMIVMQMRKQLQPIGYFDFAKKEYDAFYQKVLTDIEQLDYPRLLEIKNKGMASYNMKQYKEAIQHFEEYQKISPQKPDLEVLFTAGEASQCLQDFYNAIHYYDKALALKSSKSKNILFKKAEVLLEQNRHQEASICCDAILKIDPSYVDAVILKGVDLYNDKNYKESEKRFLQVLVKNPNNVVCLAYLGRIYWAYRDHKKSSLFLNRSQEMQADNVSSLCSRGVLLYELGLNNCLLLAEAEKDFNKALELNIAYNEAYMYLGHIYYRQNQFNKAYQYYMKVEGQNRCSYDNVLLYNKAHCIAKLYSERSILLNSCFYIIKSILEKHPSNVEFLHDFVDSLLNIGGFSDALKICRRKLHGQYNPQIEAALAYIYALLSKSNLADERMQNAIKYAHSDLDKQTVYWYKARIL
ncbi:MAG: hypothetical protein M3P33_04545, partial [bacterium]|nr:hypothetical protein [bacterium]